MKNKILFSLVMVLVVVSGVGVVQADGLFSDAGVEYDSEINKQLNNSIWVGVFMELNDISEVDNLLSDFSETEFIFKSKSPNRIVGDITKEGFVKLINDSRVKAVYYNIPVHATDSEIEENENKISLFWIIIPILIILLIIISLIIKRKKK